MSWSPSGIDGVFFLSLATIVVGVISVSSRYCLRSRCEHIACCWGLFSVDRRVDLEAQERMAELELGIQSRDEEVKTEEKNSIDLTHISK